MWQRILPIVFASMLSGCAFVTMTPAAQRVQVLERAPTGCEARGEVVVTMTHKVGPYERDELRVRDELEILARNEAPRLGANRVSPMGAAEDGRQRWAMWRCS